MSPGRILIFLKAPRPGFVKTRLAAELDDEAAASICKVLLDRTVAALRGFDRVELRVAPDDALAEVARWRRAGWKVSPQGPGDLGERLARGFAEAFQVETSPVLAIGTDCPGLDREDLEEAFDLLQREDVVLGPAEDGGYWLIGMRAPNPGVFREIPWSSPEVFRATCERAKAQGLTLRAMRRLADVDTLSDWRHWLRNQPL